MRDIVKLQQLIYHTTFLFFLYGMHRVLFLLHGTSTTLLLRTLFSSYCYYLPIYIVSKNHPHFSGLEGVITFFKFMEHQDHILGIFKRVQADIMRKLQQIECLPVSSDDDQAIQQQSVAWALPSTVIVSKHDNSNVVTPNMLKDHLNLTYIHPEMKKKGVISSEVLRNMK